MKGKRLEAPAVKVTWRIDAEDAAWLRETFPGLAAEVARRLVRRGVAGMKAEMARRDSQPPA